MTYKVAHFGDIQINLNTEHAERTTEYRSALFAAAKSVIAQNVDFVVIAGDIFERFATTDAERQLYAEFIHALLGGLPNMHIIVIDGNHDIRKRNLEYFDGIGTAVQTNVLSEIAATINSNRYHYSRNSCIYEFNDVAFACWSELAKYDSNLHGCPYASLDSSAIDKLKSLHMLIDVYHGTIAGAKDMGNNFDFAPDDVQLRGHCAMLGHIHKYQQLGNAVYCSSLVQRAFNEGIRINANAVEYDYSNEHGYALWTIDTVARSYTVQHVPIWQAVQMVTIVMDKNMTKDMLISILRQFASKSLSIKLVLDEPIPEALAFMYNHCKDSKQFKIKKTEAIVKQAVHNGIELPETVELSVDTFANIAENLVRPRIFEQHASDKTYANEVLSKTIDILKQECGFHLHPESRSKIVLKRANIVNFKTIGEATIDFADNGLFAMRGQNGQGKTTCFEAIAFALTGQHNRTFKRNAKNKQFLRLFNDKQPDNDIVKVAVWLTIDGKQHCIQVILQKYMSPDWTLANWKSCITKITKTLQIFEDDLDGQLLYAGDDADAWLMQRFGTYEDFAVLHLLDQSTLESIKYMQPDELSNFILQRLGYSVLSRFQYYYQGCKNNELLKTPKPSNKTYVQICQELIDTELQLKQTNEQLDSKVAEHAAISNDIQALTDTLHAELNKKTNVPIELIATWQKQIGGYDKATIKSMLDNERVHNAGLLQQIAANEQLHMQYQQTKSEVDTAADKLIASASAWLNNAITSHQQQIDDLQKTLYDIAVANGNLQNRKQQLQTLIANCEKSVNDIEQVKIPAMQSQIDNLKPDVCPFCQQHVGKAKIDLHRTELEQQIRQLRAECDTILTKQRGYEQDLANIEQPTDTADVTDKIAALQAELKEYQAKLSKLATADYKMQVIAANCAELYERYNDLQLRVNNIDTGLPGLLTESNQQISAMELAVRAFEHLDAYAMILQQNALIEQGCATIQSNIDAKRSALATLQSTIDNMRASIATYDAAIAQLTDLQSKTVAYNICIEALEHYKWLIHQAMPQYLYRKVCGVVNGYVQQQNLPCSIQPWLSEDNFGQIVLIDRMQNGQVLQRSILEASGMEITIAGLVICLALHEAKLAVDFPMILIDELSGKLSQGTVNDKTDYLNVFLEVLRHAASNCQIMVVDHRLSDDAFDSITTIVKDNVTNVSYAV